MYGVPTIVRDPIRFPTAEQGNRNHPLPLDYDELSDAGQRLARLNAVSLQATPDEYLAAWQFFRRYYLAHEDAGFYDQFSESPSLHGQIVKDSVMRRAAAIVVPRGFAKSTILVEECTLLDVLSRPGMRVGFVKAKGAFVALAVSSMRRQLEHNAAIVDDFAHDFGGSLRPKRGDAVWDMHTLELTSRSVIWGIGIESKGRGLRSYKVVPDDVEHDPEGTTDRQALTEAFIYKLTRIYIPMLRRGSRLVLIGSLLDTDVFLYHVATTIEDPLFANKLWHRRVYGALDESGESVWKGAYPTEFLREQEIMMGPDGFAAEFLSNPAVRTDALLRVTPMTEYRIAGKSHAYLGAPHTSDALVEFTRTEGRVVSGAPEHLVETPTTAPLRKLLDDMLIFLTMDYAPTTSMRSDYSAIQVLGLDSRNDLWSLDLWVGRKTESVLLRIMWALAFRWQAKFVGVEAVGLQQSFVNQVVADRARLLTEERWVPRVIPIKYRSKASKETRIARLEWRFRLGKVKLPAHRRYEWPYRELFFEINHFSPNVRARHHDDALDTLSMSQELLTGRQARPHARNPAEETLVQALERGERYFPGTRVPLTLGLGPEQIPRSVLNTMREEHQRRQGANTLAAIRESIDADADAEQSLRDTQTALGLVGVDYYPEIYGD